MWLLSLLLVTPVHAEPQAEPASDQEASAMKAPSEKVALAFIASLTGKKFDEARNNFSDKMKEAMPSRGLVDLWNNQLVATAGPFEKRGKHESGRQEGFDVYYVDLHFERKILTLKVVVNTDNKIGGLWITGDRPRKG